MPVLERHPAVEAFVEAARWFAGLVAVLGADQLEGPGLGEWTLRQLVAHGSRAMATVADYLRPAPSGQAPPDDDPLGAAGAYFLSVHDNAALHSDVAERGRQEAARLGDDPAGAVATLASRVTALVSGAPAEAVFETRVGDVGFASYLCTRTVELVVHGIDVCGAAGMEASVPDHAGAVTLAVMAELAHRRGETVAVVRALGGRAALPADLSLFS